MHRLRHIQAQTHQDHSRATETSQSPHSSAGALYRQSALETSATAASEKRSQAWAIIRQHHQQRIDKDIKLRFHSAGALKKPPMLKHIDVVRDEIHLKQPEPKDLQAQVSPSTPRKRAHPEAKRPT